MAIKCTLIFDLMRNIYIYNACIYVYILMTGKDSAAVWTDFVPEAIHNPVASGVGSFDWTYMLCTSAFYIVTDFVLVF